jgi:hypothetical protein
MSKRELRRLRPSQIRHCLRTALAFAWTSAPKIKKCNFPHQLCKNGKHYTNWKNVPDEDKLVLYKHMDSTGLMWFDAATFEKHKIIIPPKFAHLLGNAMGPNRST